MPYLIHSFLFVCFFVYLGIGLTYLLTPGHLKQHTILLSPVVGYSFLTLLGWHAYGLDYGGTDRYAYYLLILPTFASIYMLVLLGKRKEHQHQIFNRALLRPIGLSAIIFGVISIPFVIDGVGATSVAISNNDIPDSSTVTRLLKEFSKTDTVGILGQQTAIRWLAQDSIFGGSLAVAVACSLFSWEPYQVQSLSIGVFFMFSGWIVYVLARTSFRYSRAAAVGVAAVYGLNPVMHYIIFQGYHGQIIATCLSLTLIFLHLDAIPRCKQWSDYYRYLPLIVLLNWGISITYPHLLFFIYPPLGVYCILWGIYKKSRAIPIRWSVFVVLVFVIMTLLSPYRAKAMVSYIFFMGSVGGFAFHPWISPATFVGLSIGSDQYLHSSTLQLYLSVVVVLIMVIGLVYTYQKNRRVCLIAGSFLGVVLSGYVLLYTLGKFQIIPGGNYSSFKLLSYFLPFLLLSVLLIFRYSSHALAKRVSSPLAILLALLILINLYSGYRLLPWPPHLIVTEAMAQLQTIDRNPEIRSVNILGKDYWNIMWATYFLMHKQLYFETSTYMGREAGPLAGEWNLIKRSPADLKTMSGHLCGEAIEVNAVYLLTKACSSQNVPSKG
jgi:hypothetical protein